MFEDVNAKLLIQSKLRQTFARISWSANGVHIELRIALRVPIRPWADVRALERDRAQHVRPALHARLIDSCFARL